MTTISKETFKFLQDIKVNNNREWFLKNKERYESAKKELSDFGEVMLHIVAGFDKSFRLPDDKPYVFRIYRDARFAKGNPYKSNLGILLVKGGRPAMHSRAGYYLHIEPGRCFLAGGCYSPPPEWLHNIRENIAKNPEKIKAILNDKTFKKYFELGGEKLKTNPKGFPKDHPEIELLRHKSFMAIHRWTDKEVMERGFLDKLVKACQALYPFDEYLNKQLP